MEEILEKAISSANSEGVTETIAIGTHNDEYSIRFANNSITVSKKISLEEIAVCLSKGKKRIISSTTDMERVEEFVRGLAFLLNNIPDSEFSYLANTKTKYLPNRLRADEGLYSIIDKLPGMVSAAINSALSSGAQRVAGTLSASIVKTYLATSTGITGEDKRTSINLNLRAFSDSDSTGHGLVCSSTISGFNPEKAGTKAGNESVMMKGARQIEDNTYQVLLSPTVVANLTDYIGLASSAYSVETGASFLSGKLGKTVANEKINVKDHGFIQGCLGGRDFDDEGTRTRSTVIIESGLVKNYIHNLSTAKRWNTESTGNAGLISPHSWNLEISPGDSNYEEMVGEIKRGVIITSNWYTRFNNYQTGEFSTVPRDACFFVENGEIKHGVKGMRLSDRMERLLSSVMLVSRERDWIEWWEVNTPALCPWLLVDGIRLSRAFE
jgi:PmbA protein